MGTQPLLAIVEVELPGPTNGLEFLRELHSEYGANIPVILVSAERTAPLDNVAGLLLGADDYISKPFDEGELLARVRRSLGRGAATDAKGMNREPPHVDVGLSPRESEILALLSDGLGQAEIARKLVVSPKTVGTHIQHILGKLGVHSRAQAVAEAYRLGLVQPDFADATIQWTFDSILQPTCELLVDFEQLTEALVSGARSLKVGDFMVNSNATDWNKDGPLAAARPARPAGS